MIRGLSKADMAFQKWSAVLRSRSLKSWLQQKRPHSLLDYLMLWGVTAKDLSRVPWQFLAAELRALPTVEDEIQAVIDPVIAGLQLLTEGKEWKREDVFAAASAAAWAAVRRRQGDLLLKLIKEAPVVTVGGE